MGKNPPKIIFYLVIGFAIFQTAGFLFLCVGTIPVHAESKWKNPFDDLNVEIPGLQKMAESHPMTCENDADGKPVSCEMSWIAVYIASIYKYAIGGVGILAAVVLMIGGVMWIMAGGNSSRVGEAKSWITAAFAGLLLSLTSYTILHQVNPDLVSFSSLELDIVEEVEGDNNGAPFTMQDINTLNIPPGKITDVVNSMIGKFTYSSEKRLTCQNGLCYIDCSSFACTVLAASGINAPAPANCRTAGLFTNSPTNVDLSSMPAGILVGYPPGAANNGNGHAWVSLGNGQYAQSHGGTSGRKPGNSINIVSASSVKKVMGKYGVNTPYVYIPN